MQRFGISAAVTLLLAACFATPLLAQTGATVRVTRPAMVLETPRGDSVRVGTVQPGDVFEVLARREGWLLVAAPETGDPRPAWNRG